MTFKRLFDLYLESSLHVALAVYAFIRVTELQLGLLPNDALAWFGFFGTVVGYNFVKYDALARTRSKREKNSALNRKLTGLITISTVAFAGALFCFLKLQLRTQLISGVCVLITALYTLPFFPNRRNARSWSGLKIYIVALCWVGVTVALPVLESGIALERAVYLIAAKRFILVVVELFIFEIIDLAWDDPHLRTVPQQIGIRNTKRLGIGLLAVWMLLQLSAFEVDRFDFAADVTVVLLTAALLYFSSDRKSRYYTTFWVESIPIFWWLMLLALP